MTDAEKYLVAEQHLRVALKHMGEINRMTCLEWQAHEHKLLCLYDAAEYCADRGVELRADQGDGGNCVDMELRVKTSLCECCKGPLQADDGKRFYMRCSHGGHDIGMHLCWFCWNQWMLCHCYLQSAATIADASGDHCDVGGGGANCKDKSGPVS